jgi:hypothetical protein
MNRNLGIACTVLLLVCQSALADCEKLPGTGTLSDVVARISPRDGEIALTLAGTVTTPDRTLSHAITPSTLCMAALGTTRLNAVRVCSMRTQNSYTGNDSITPINQGARFSLGYTISSDAPTNMNAELDRTGCPPVVYRIVLGNGARTNRVYPRPDKLAANEVAFDGATNSDLSRWTVEINQSRQPEHHIKIGPPALLDYHGDLALVLRWLTRGLFVILLVLTVFYAVLPRIAGISRPLDGIWLRPARTALTFVASGILINVCNLLTANWWRSTGRTLAAHWGGGGFGKFLQSSDLRTDLLSATMLAGLAVLAMSGLVIKHARTAMAFVLFRNALLLALVAEVITLTSGFVEHHISIGFEIPALLVSVLLSAATVGALRPGLGLKAPTAAMLTILVAATVFFPIAPVVYGYLGGAPPISENTSAWFRFLVPWAGQCLFSIALLLAGFHLLHADTTETARNTARGALILLLLSVVDVRGIGLSDAVALAGLWFLADHMLFKAASGAGAPAANHPVLDTLPYDEIRRTLQTKVVLGGVLTVVVFWLQFSVNPSGNLNFAALFAVKLLLTSFTKGALAVLLLGCAFNMLRGGSATAKAALIAAAVIAASLAANILNLLNSRHVLPTIVSNIDLVTALLLVAVVGYDVPNARRQVGDLPLKDMFKGTTLGHVVPIVAGAAAAFYAAISPSINSAIAGALGELLRQLLPHASNIAN